MNARILSAAALLALSSGALAQSTAFTYQGQLKNGSTASNGLHDIRFRLFDAAEGGTQVGTTQCVDNVSVTNGVFTTSLDFGQQFATPAPRFLEIEVRVDSGLTCANTTGYTILAPRQLLSAAPIANHAKSAFALDAADGSPASAVFVDNVGNVGIGTTTTTSLLSVGSTTNRGTLNVVGSSTAVPLVTLSDSRAGGRQFSLYGGLSGLGSFNIFDQTAAAHRLTINSGGNVGIGTVSPAVPLHIARDLDPVLILHDIGSNATQAGYVGFWNGSGAETGWMGFGTPGSPHMTILNARSGGNIVLDPGPGAVVQVPVLQITGADLAEKFPASETLEPGMVVAIDRDNAGKLCLARGSYNRCVAGVVSGANNFSAGAVLGNLPGHEDAPAVALSGRVYVHCDAAAGPIEPGDLLTTSDTPGHAMKATDRDRSHGAVIGKAMTSLKDGKGLVLVLVNLQ